ncbi:MAG: InlB B-repeat-containing protein [Treponema sp.]|jgi:uncharacterized repeat protein (TIGR02543 family)|nr:InlB B-repeat-containing protein [Treponema sp.]
MKPSVLLELVFLLTLAACPTPTGENSGIEPIRKIQYTITFDSNDGSEVPPITADEGSEISRPEDPDRDNYEFVGWYSDVNGGVLYSWPLLLTEDIEVYAQWRSEEEEGENYTLAFDSHGGTEIDDITAVAGTSILKPADPQQDGYVFTGWFTEEYGGNLYSWPYTPTEDVIIHAQWQDPNEDPIEQYTITFNSQDGNAIPSITANEETIIIKPTDPVRAGFIFLGWFTNKTGGTIMEWPHTLAEDQTLYAHWQSSEANTYTIAFDTKGGSEVKSISNIDGTLIYAPEDPTKTGYTFLGWFSEAAGGKKYTWPHTLTKDVTVYAHWDPSVYTVEYDANGGAAENSGNITPTTHTYGVESPLAENIFIKASHSFDGWNTQADGMGVNYAARENVTDLTSENGGTVKLFARWYNNEDKAYTIIFESQMGTAVDPITFNGGTKVGNPKDPVRTAYTFEGWFSEAEGGTKHEWPFTLLDEDGNIIEGLINNETNKITMYAHWETTSYTITYNNTTEVSSNPNPNSYTINSLPFSLMSPTRTGYDFAAWYDNAEFTGNPITHISADRIGITGLYAKWTGKSYPGTLNYNDETDRTVKIDLIYGSAMPQDLTIPVREFYAFEGFYDASENGVQYYGSDGAGTRNWDKTQPATLYARWKLVSYTVTLNLNGGSWDGSRWCAESSPGIYVFEYKPITLPLILETANWERHRFNGWYENPDCTGDPVSPIAVGTTGDKTYWASWTELGYTIQYREGAAGVNGSTPPTFHYIGEQGSLAACGFTRAGYIFGGWSTEPNGEGKLYKAKVPRQNLPYKAGDVANLFAYWLPEGWTIDLDMYIDNNILTGYQVPSPEYLGMGEKNWLWVYDPQTAEFLIYGGPWHYGKTVYVTGSTTVRRIRVMAFDNNGLTWPNRYNSGAFSFTSWRGGAMGQPTGWKMKPSYMIPQILGVSHRPEVSYANITFVNATIDLDLANRSRVKDSIEPSRNGNPVVVSPVVLGPHHWPNYLLDGTEVAETRHRQRPNDHEVNAVVSFEGENKLYSPYAKAFTLWDSRFHAGPTYMAEMPATPKVGFEDQWGRDYDDDMNWDKNTGGYYPWEDYRKAAILFVKRWDVEGFSFYWAGEDWNYARIWWIIHAYGWGASSLNLKFADSAFAELSTVNGNSDTLKGGWNHYLNAGNADTNHWGEWVGGSYGQLPVDWMHQNGTGNDGVSPRLHY